MLGQRLLERFNDYDLREVDTTFKSIVSLCLELNALERENKLRTFEASTSGSSLPVSEKLKLSRKWNALFDAVEDVDFLFIEDY